MADTWTGGESRASESRSRPKEPNHRSWKPILSHSSATAGRPGCARFASWSFAALLEVVLLMPFVDHLADANHTIHFTQHGFIFGGGVLLGLAIRDVQRASRR